MRRSGHVGWLHWWLLKGEETGVRTLVVRWRKPSQELKHDPSTSLTKNGDTL